MQIFQNTANLMKQTMNQIHQAIQSTRKSRPAQKPFDQTEFVQNKSALFKIAAKREHRCDGNGDYFSVCNFNATIWLTAARLEKIVNKTVYCKSAMAHFGSSPFSFVW
jgi:hypothetical protein